MTGKAGNIGICIVPNCTRPPRSRGVCSACYMAFSRQVHRGNVTWKDLVSKGLILQRFAVSKAPASAAMKGVSDANKDSTLV